jgi:signal-transduction protein with cAMP-binding, CBS, and nucleotidyltransferase domain
MTRHVFTCTPETSIEELMRQMTRRRIRHLPVIRDGGLCGIVSIGDVVKNRLLELETEATTLREYIGGR